jgi:hypothetical protein
MILSKYAVAAIQVVTVIVTSMVASLADNTLTTAEVWQIAVIGIGAIGSVVVPLLEKGPAGLLKFALAVAGAIAAAIVPVVDTANGGAGWTASAFLIVLLAGLNAALTALGVSVRMDAVKEALASPDISDRATVAVDQPAVKVAVAHGADVVSAPAADAVG